MSAPIPEPLPIARSSAPEQAGSASPGESSAQELFALLLGTVVASGAYAARDPEASAHEGSAGETGEVSSELELQASATPTDGSDLPTNEVVVALPGVVETSGSARGEPTSAPAGADGRQTAAPREGAQAIPVTTPNRLEVPMDRNAAFTSQEFGARSHEETGPARANEDARQGFGLERMEGSDSKEPHPMALRDVAPAEVRSEIEAPIVRAAESPRLQTTASQAASRPIPELTAVNESEIVEGARILLRDGGGSARIHLYPPQLGGLDIRITITDGMAQIHFLADRAAVAELIHHHLPELRSVLQAQGLQLDRVEVAYREGADLSEERDGDGRSETLEWSEEEADRPGEGASAEDEGGTVVSPEPDYDPNGSTRGASRMTSLGAVDVHV